MTMPDEVMRAKRHVIVLMGGISSEHDVSLSSGENILRHIDRDKYKVSEIRISRDGEWQFDHPEGETVPVADAVPRLRDLHPDCVFIALHGPYGEDGRIQGMLDTLGIPYTGSGCRASAIAMDKIRAKQLAAHAGISVPDDIIFTQRHWKDDREGLMKRIGEMLGYPCVVKSPAQGSSLGMAIPQSEPELGDAMRELLGYGFTFMAERYARGVEVTCGILDFDEDDAPIALPVTEIRPRKSRFFDYTAKYTADATDEITPAEISDTLRDRIQDVARRAHTVIGCRGFSRSDMIIAGDDVVWLEINTIPGFTRTSLLPQMAAAHGMDFEHLIDGIIQAALI